MSQGFVGTQSISLYDGMPVGACIPWTTSVAPVGWIICDGSAISRTTYSTLFSVIGTTYGTGDGSATFNIPDIRGRIPVGADPTGAHLPVNSPSLAATGGEEQHSLSIAELAAHTHAYGAGVNVATGGTTVNSMTAQTFANTASTGSGTAHNNLQPYVALNWIIKYAFGYSGTQAVWSSPPVFSYNYLYNGGYNFCQRTTVVPSAGGNPFTPVQTTGSAADTTHDGYGPDRWKCAFQTATLKYQRIDTQASLETGITSRFYGNFVQQTGAGKFVVYQILEGTQTLPLANQTLVFQCKMKASSAKTIRMAIMQLSSSGTMDSLPTTIVSASTWGANSTDPTWATNLAVVGSTVSQSVGTAWATYSVTVTAPSNAKNLICAIWTDSQFAINDNVSMTEAGLYISTSVISQWQPRLIPDELTLCQRFYDKSWTPDTPPGTTFSSTLSGVGAVSFGGTGWTAANAATFIHRVLKRTTSPTFLTWDAAGSSGKISQFLNAAWANGRTPTQTYCDDQRFMVESDQTATTSFTLFGWAVDAEL